MWRLKGKAYCWDLSLWKKNTCNSSASISVSFYVWINHKADFFLWILRIFCVISKIVPGTLHLPKLCAWPGPPLTQNNMPTIKMLFLAVIECDWYHLHTWAENQSIRPGILVLFKEDEYMAGWTSTTNITKAAWPSSRLCSAPEDYRDPNLMETLSCPPDNYHCLWGLETNLIL